MAINDRDYDGYGRYVRYGHYNRYNQFVPDSPPLNRRDAEEKRDREWEERKRNDDLRGGGGSLERL